MRLCYTYLKVTRYICTTLYKYHTGTFIQISSLNLWNSISFVFLSKTFLITKGIVFLCLGYPLDLTKIMLKVYKFPCRTNVYCRLMEPYSASLIIEYIVTMKRFGQTNNNPANEGGIRSALDEDHRSRSTTMSCGLAGTILIPKLKGNVQKNNYSVISFLRTRNLKHPFTRVLLFLTRCKTYGNVNYCWTCNTIICFRRFVSQSMTVLYLQKLNKNAYFKAGNILLQ